LSSSQPQDRPHGETGNHDLPTSRTGETADTKTLERVPWPKGADQIRALIEQGTLMKLTSGPDLTSVMLEGARSDLGAAEVILQNYPSTAFDNAYDAARKSGAAILECQRLRVKSGEGGHAAIGAAIEAQIGKAEGRRFQSLRYIRNATQCPSPDKDAAVADDAADAIEFAKLMLTAAETMTAIVGVFR